MTTFKEIHDGCESLRHDLIELSKTEIGMGNYLQVLRRYQKLVLGVINLMQAFADAADNALNPSKPSS